MLLLRAGSIGGEVPFVIQDTYTFVKQETSNNVSGLHDVFWNLKKNNSNNNEKEIDFHSTCLLVQSVTENKLLLALFCGLNVFNVTL